MSTARKFLRERNIEGVEPADILFLLGAVLGDACLSSEKKNPSVIRTCLVGSEEQRDFIENFRNICAKFPKNRFYKGRIVKVNNSKQTLVYNDSSLTPVLHAYKIYDTKTKINVSEELWSEPINHRLNFVGGLCGADGSIMCSKKNNTWMKRWSIVQGDKQYWKYLRKDHLLCFVQQTLKEIGVNTRISRFKKPTGSYGSVLYVQCSQNPFTWRTLASKIKTRNKKKDDAAKLLAKLESIRYKGKKRIISS